jgi:hypothetical protein
MYIRLVQGEMLFKFQLTRSFFLVLGVKGLNA